MFATQANATTQLPSPCNILRAHNLLPSYQVDVTFLTTTSILLFVHIVNHTVSEEF